MLEGQESCCPRLPAVALCWCVLWMLYKCLHSDVDLTDWLMNWSLGFIFMCLPFHLIDCLHLVSLLLLSVFKLKCLKASRIHCWNWGRVPSWETKGGRSFYPCLAYSVPSHTAGDQQPEWRGCWPCSLGFRLELFCSLPNTVQTECTRTTLLEGLGHGLSCQVPFPSAWFSFCDVLPTSSFCLMWGASEY